VRAGLHRHAGQGLRCPCPEAGGCPACSSEASSDTGTAGWTQLSIPAHLLDRGCRRWLCRPRSRAPLPTICSLLLLLALLLLVAAIGRLQGCGFSGQAICSRAGPRLVIIPQAAASSCVGGSLPCHPLLLLYPARLLRIRGAHGRTIPSCSAGPRLVIQNNKLRGLLLLPRCLLQLVLPRCALLLPRRALLLLLLLLLRRRRRRRSRSLCKLVRLLQPALHVALLGAHCQCLLLQLLDALAQHVGGGQLHRRLLGGRREIRLQVRLPGQRGTAAAACP
jgi:hypothetical protein